MSIKRNLVANFVASVWSAGLSICLVPIYVRFVGIEAYGLVGTYAALQAFAGLLDLGFTSTMTREMARVSSEGGDGSEARTLVRTMEIVYWAIAFLIGLLVIVLAPVLAHQWFTGVKLSAHTIQQTLILIGFVMLLQWPFSFYSGGLTGLQQQVLLGGVQIGVGTLRGVGAILVLWLVSPTIQAYFAWQIAINAFSTFLVAILLWRYLPPATEVPRFQIRQLQKVSRFAAGMTIISVLGLALTQSDKIVLSKLLTLEDFGYYTLAGTVAAGLYTLVIPVYNAVFPRFTQLVAQGDRTRLARLYHQGAQVLSVILLPVVTILVLYSREVVLVWTGNPTTAASIYKVVALLAIGTGLHGISHVPWALQLAYGWTRLGFYKNLVSVVVLVPLIIIFASRYGAIGAAAMWMVVNLGEVVVSLPVMHYRLLRGELHRWYLTDVGLPLLAALAVAASVRTLIWDFGMPRPLLLLSLGAIWLGATLASALATPGPRSWIMSVLYPVLSRRNHVGAK